MKIILTCLLLMSALVACSPSAPPASPTPSIPVPEGEVSILSPQSGVVIYAELMNITGTSSALPDEGFRLQIFTAEDEQIAETSVIPGEDGGWATEIRHNYTGEPTEITILSLPADPAIPGDYDVSSAVLSSLEYRPEGSYAAILSPSEGNVIGGDQIQIVGNGSGLFENTLLLSLTSSAGDVLAEEIVTLNNPYFVDEVIWTADMEISGYTGPAVLRAYYQDAENGEEITLSSVNVMLSVAAG